MRGFAVCALVLTQMTAAASGKDISGAKDHPLVGRYQGSSIVSYKSSDFDRATLLRAPHDYAALLEKGNTKDRSGPEWLTAEGRRTEIRYELPGDRSSLEVIRNFENSLEAQGLAVVFSCSDAECLSGSLRDLYLLGEQLDPTNPVSTAYAQHARYLLALRDRAGGTDYVGILVGEDQQERVAFVQVLETKAMEGDKIALVKADDMRNAFAKGASVSIYGIHFDFDKATLRPDSKPSLDEIAKALGAQPDLKLKVVGHTDNRGSAGYNQDLSQRRAAAVAAALVQNYGIAAARLAPEGAGMSRPIAPNDNENGRAKNRRVELVAQPG
jgi:outer membrane protein OmpA-like peptidoglycan-associated protein